MNKKSKKLSPKEAKTIKEVCSLETDNYSTKDFWIMVDPCNKDVTIMNQRVGESATQKISIHKKDFNKLIEWYLKDQKLHV